MGTELIARGVALHVPAWSAEAVQSAPEVVAAIHREHASAGATVHTAATFRTRRRDVGPTWDRRLDRAVAIARDAVPPGHRIAGSIGPIADCYRPDLSPADPGPEHRDVATRLAAAGCDLLLCETFPHVGEALAAVDACVGTGLPTWVAFTAGPHADLLDPRRVRDGAREAARRGAAAVLVNCTPARDTLRFVDAIAGCGVPFGAYANAGDAADHLGWDDRSERAAQAYADLAATWIDAGATIVGGCCGTSPRHVHALARRFAPT